MTHTLADRLTEVRARIAAACGRVGRSPDEVTLVAVSKYVDTATTRALHDLGCRDLGEARPQQLWQKADELADLTGLRWHLVGHLQRNKVERTLPLVSLIHSVDSVRLLQAIENAGRDQKRSTAVLLEVNISGDAAKHGFAPAEMPDLLSTLKKLRYVDVLGLMGMASLEGDLDAARREFRSLRELRDHLVLAWDRKYPLTDLSMGMSGDFEVAIEEGATIVRVGSMLFDDA